MLNSLIKALFGVGSLEIMASESFVMCALILLLIPLETTAFELPKEDLYEGQT